MREIKYRAWDKEEKEMTEWEELKDNIDFGKLLCNEYGQYDEFELMQYTGIKDKNGVEIYEGDYIRFTDCDSNQGYEGEVALKGGAFCMLHKIEGAMRNIIMATMLDVDGYIEIIGNIYENKNLLEVTK